MDRPTSKSPAVSHVQRVDVCERSSGGSSRSQENAVRAATKETRTESVAM
jgi:hypothetical protein